jgi:hypothetical protein
MPPQFSGLPVLWGWPEPFGDGQGRRNFGATGKSLGPPGNRRVDGAPAFEVVAVSLEPGGTIGLPDDEGPTPAIQLGQGVGAIGRRGRFPPRAVLVQPSQLGTHVGRRRRKQLGSQPVAFGGEIGQAPPRRPGQRPGRWVERGEQVADAPNAGR